MPQLITSNYRPGPPFRLQQEDTNMQATTPPNLSCQRHTIYGAGSPIHQYRNESFNFLLQPSSYSLERSEQQQSRPTIDATALFNSCKKTRTLKSPLRAILYTTDLPKFGTGSLMHQF